MEPSKPTVFLSRSAEFEPMFSPTGGGSPTTRATRAVLGVRPSVSRTGCQVANLDGRRPACHLVAHTLRIVYANLENRLMVASYSRGDAFNADNRGSGPSADSCRDRDSAASPAPDGGASCWPPPRY
jgi:hypothetical protein